MRILSTTKTFAPKCMWVLFIGMMTFTACQNEEGGDVQEATELELQSVQDDAFAEDVYEGVLDISNEVLEANATTLESKTKSGKKSTQDTVWRCATVNITIEGNTKQVVIDFGEGCEGRDGRIRTGKIINTFERRFSIRASRVTTTFEDFTVDGVKVEGTKVTTHVAQEGETPKHRVEVIGGVLTFPDERTITWESNRVRIFEEGFDTPRDRSDDVFSLTGQQQGTNRQGESYASRTTSPLIFKGECRLQGIRQPSSGIRQVNPFNGAVRTVDFGDGDCDRTFTVTIGGRSQTVSE